MTNSRRISIQSTKKPFRNISDEEVFPALSVLAEASGTFSIEEGNGHYIEISSEEGSYFVVTGFSGDDLVLIDNNKSVPVDCADYVQKYINGNECLEHNTVDDFEAVSNILKHFINTGEFCESESYVWINCNLKKHSKRFSF